MSAYFTSPSRPVLAPPTVAALRAEPSALLVAGMIAIFSTAGAGGLYTKGVYYDAISTVADDGTTYFKPDDLGVSDPGRWVLHPGLSGTGASSDFADPVIHVNWATGANDAVPSVICGLSVDRGSVAGVERDRAVVVWDESLSRWAFALDDAGDDQTITAYLPVAANGFYSQGGGTTGFVRLRQDDAITANFDGTTYNLAVVTSGGVAALGDSGLVAATLDANGDVTITSRIADVLVNGANFVVADASGLNPLLEADVGGAVLDVNGRLRAYDPGGPTLVLDVDVGAATATVNGVLRSYDPTGVLKFFQADSTEVLVQRDGVAASNVVGLAIRNTTPSTAITTVQRAPQFVREAHARVSGADAQFLVRETFVPTTSAGWRDVFEVSVNGGSSYSEFMRLTTSTPGQFVEALLAANAFATTTGGGFFFDSDNSGMFRGGSGDLELIARSSSQAFLLRSPTNSSVAAFRLYANGATLGAAKTIVEFGDVSAGFTLRSRIMGDGVVECPAFHLDATVHTTGTFAAALYTLHKLDLSGGDVTATLPEATDANAGCEVLLVQTVAGTSNAVLTPSAGSIEGGATVSVVGLGSAPLLALRLISTGATYGWKVC